MGAHGVNDDDRAVGAEDVSDFEQVASAITADHHDEAFVVGAEAPHSVLERVDDVDETDVVAMSALRNDDMCIHTTSSYVDAVRGPPSDRWMIDVDGDTTETLRFEDTGVGNRL